MEMTQPRAAKSEAAPTTAAGIDARSWLALGILVLMTVLSFLDRGIIALMVDPIRADLGISDVQIGLLQGFAFALLYAFSSVPMGWIADRWSRRGVIFLGISGWSIATACCGLANSFGALFAARVAVGVGEATLPPAANGIVGDLFPRRRLAMALGILGAGASIGGGLAMVVGGYVVGWTERVGGLWGLAPWQTAFVLVGLPGLLIAPLIFLIPAVTHTPAPQGPAIDESGDESGDQPGSFAAFLRSHARYLTGLFGGVGLTAVIGYSAGAWMPAHFSRTFGLSVETIGLTVGLINGICGTIGFVGGGWLVDRLHASGTKDAHFRYLITVLALLGILCVTAFGLVGSPTVLFILLGFIALLMPTAGPALAHLQSVTPRRFRSRTMAIFFLVMNLLGMTVGPAGAALLSTHVFGGPADIGKGVAVTCGLASIVGVALFVMALRPARQAARDAGL